MLRGEFVEFEVAVSQGSVLGPVLFAVYCRPVSDIIRDPGVRYHQYADDVQLHLAMSTDNTAAELQDCLIILFLPRVPTTSDSGTCRTACSSTQTSRRL